jgi:hypothetical protein
MWIADREGQRFGILQPGATAPNGYDRKNQGQRDKQQHPVYDCFGRRANAWAAFPFVVWAGLHSWLISGAGVAAITTARSRPNVIANI